MPEGIVALPGEALPGGGFCIPIDWKSRRLELVKRWQKSLDQKRKISRERGTPPLPSTGGLFRRQGEGGLRRGVI
jgi:hypothetical protein